MPLRGSKTALDNAAHRSDRAVGEPVRRGPMGSAPTGPNVLDRGLGATCRLSLALPFIKEKTATPLYRRPGQARSAHALGEGFRVMSRRRSEDGRHNRVVHDQPDVRRLSTEPAFRHHPPRADVERAAAVSGNARFSTAAKSIAASLPQRKALRLKSTATALSVIARSIASPATGTRPCW